MGLNTGHTADEESIGLGREKNAKIAEALLRGDYESIVSVIGAEPDKNLACEVVLKSMFNFKHRDRASDSHDLARTALKQDPTVMAALIRYSYHTHRTTERFWLNPNKPSDMLFLDRHGNIITFPKSVQGAGERYIQFLSNYTVLTGSEAGQTFQNNSDRGIPMPSLS